MSMQNSRDPRAILAREKYFSLRPKPLERWLWRQAIAPAAERVFWLHWEEGMRRGDWCSELSLKQVARECCIDLSTVTRAYQILKDRGLIRREDPGRDPRNPFQQAIAITEVRVPRDLLQTLSQTPNRQPRATRQDTSASPAVVAASQSRPETLNRPAMAALLQRLSQSERAAFFVASRDRVAHMAFDANSALSSAEQQQVGALLARVSTGGEPAMTPSITPQRMPPAVVPPRRLSPLEAARLRKAITGYMPAVRSADIFREVLWSVEEGALRRFEQRLAINIALKKIREGAWTRPNRMPPAWMRDALPETCSAA